MGGGVGRYDRAVPGRKNRWMPKHLKAGMRPHPSALLATGQAAGAQPLRGLAARTAQPWPGWVEGSIRERLNIDLAEAGEQLARYRFGPMQELQPALGPALPQRQGHLHGCQAAAKQLEGS